MDCLLISLARACILLFLASFGHTGELMMKKVYRVDDCVELLSSTTMTKEIDLIPSLRPALSRSVLRVAFVLPSSETNLFDSPGKCYI